MRATPTSGLVFLLGVLGIAACSDLPTLDEANSRTISPSEGQSWLDAAMNLAKGRIEAVRGASFKGPVRGVWVRAGGYDSLVMALDAQVGLYEESPSWDLTERTMVALGMVDSLGQWAKARRAFDQGSILGFYLPQTATLYVFDDPDLDGLYHTVVHEMVHALQDQRFGLDAISDRVRETDDDKAFASLVEGEAEYVTLAVELDNPAASVLHDSVVGRAYTYDELADVLQKWGGPQGFPLSMTLPDFTPYETGHLFVSRTRLRGGWASIDSLYGAPPKSTRETIWGDSTPIIDWNPGGAPAVSGAWRPLQTGRLGVARLASLLHGTLPTGTTLRSILATWKGDRFWSYESDAGYALQWRMRFGDPASARAFATAFWNARSPRRARLGHSSIVADGTLFLAIPQSGSRGSQMEVSGSEVAFVENFASAEADSLVGSLLALPERASLAARGATTTFSGGDWTPPRPPFPIGPAPRPSLNPR